MHISYRGLKPYRHDRYDELLIPAPNAVLMVLSLFSVYFIAGNLLRLSPFWRKQPYFAYLLLSTVLISQSFIAFIGAMHAPPY